MIWSKCCWVEKQMVKELKINFFFSILSFLFLNPRPNFIIFLHEDMIGGRVSLLGTLNSFFPIPQIIRVHQNLF